MGERLTFGYISDDDSDKANRKGISDKIQRPLIRSSPDLNRESFEEFADGEFEHPETGIYLLVMTHAAGGERDR